MFERSISPSAAVRLLRLLCMLSSSGRSPNSTPPPIEAFRDKPGLRRVRLQLGKTSSSGEVIRPMCVSSLLGICHSGPPLPVGVSLISLLRRLSWAALTRYQSFSEIMTGGRLPSPTVTDLIWSIDYRGDLILPNLLLISPPESAPHFVRPFHYIIHLQLTSR